MQERIFSAAVESIGEMTDFVNDQLEQHHCPMKTINQIDITLDELFGNIAHYAYPDGQGEAAVAVEFHGDALCSVVITLRDQGVPYNPLGGDDPDITLSAEDRPIGGLGIFLSKKLMDDLHYEYRDGQNILRITKALY